MHLFRHWFRKTPATALTAEVSRGHGQRAMRSMERPIPDALLPLWQLYNSRQLLEVRIGSAKLSYQTMIIAIDIARGLIWLDELFPQQRMLEVGDDITLRHHRSGEQLVINTQVLALANNYGASGIAIALPPLLAYTPRRAAVRYNIAEHTPVLVKFRLMGEETRFATLQDISSGGLRLQVAGNITGSLRHDAQLPLCEFSLHENLSIQCRARICSYALVRGAQRYTHIGLAFTDLPLSQRIAIEQYLHSSFSQATAAAAKHVA